MDILLKFYCIHYSNIFLTQKINFTEILILVNKLMALGEKYFSSSNVTWQYTEVLQRAHYQFKKQFRIGIYVIKFEK